ncbi:hypothetical protein [Romboutsia lituseburensis]|uniref:hypothetical protein n=1 Tax=Romboutsia lituseburensis TaxID=1537 RepID=UPI00215B387C|nr:hypothetical protein [Romboutsia lituseburensis]MCR8747127.1 hypothetical protein [Romboutsia lituseburensis]
MNIKYKILVLIGIVLIVFITIISIPNKYEINKLYSEKSAIKDIPNSFVGEDYISREKAINKAIDIFKNGFKIELDRKNLSENVYLYNTNDGYEWSITLSESSNPVKYYCNILASNGEITFIRYDKSVNNKVDSDMPNEEVLKKILKPLTDELGININSLKYPSLKNNILEFVEKKNEQLYMYNFSIDFNNEKVYYYQKYKIDNKSTTYQNFYNKLL